MTKLFDVQLPFFIPLWRRVALVALCLGWSALEVGWGNPGWSIFFLLVGVYCAHQFFWAFNPREPEEGA